VLTCHRPARSSLGVAPTNQRGDRAELAIALDLSASGYRIAFPFGEDCDYDLIVDRDGRLERVQVKYVRSDGRVIPLSCRSLSLTNGAVKRIKHYTAAMIEWLAVYDEHTHRCFYVPAAELGSGKSILHLRLAPAANNQVKGIRPAADYEGLPPPIFGRLGIEVEPAGLEPAASSVQGKRSPN
jgi:hypothetical protein